MSWVIRSTDPVLLNNIKNFEGTISAQKNLGYYKGDKFWTYKDHLGYPTIGYGHLIESSENYKNGLTESQADVLLAKDLQSKVSDAVVVATQYKLDIPEDAQRVLVEMIFQMGKSGVLKFKNFLNALAKHDYKTAAKEMRSSLWYKQTTNRAEILAKRIEALA